jgi:hypothetical protein
MEAVQKEAEYRENSRVVDMEHYHDVRRGSSAALACFALFEPVLGINLPDEVVNHPAFKEVSVIGMDLFCWSNVSYITQTTSSTVTQAGYLFLLGSVQL